MNAKQGDIDNESTTLASLWQAVAACFQTPPRSKQQLLSEGELVIPVSPTVPYVASMTDRIDTAEERRLCRATLISTCYNEQASVIDWFESLKSQQVWPSEVIIVDAGSTDQTVQRLENFSRSGCFARCNLRILSMPNSTIAAARNYAVSHATEELLLFTDFGCVLDSAWVRWLDEAASRHPDCDWIMGGYSVATVEGLPTLISELTIPNIHVVAPERFLPSARSMAIRRAVFLAAGGFPEFLSKAAEDTLFAAKLRLRGTRAVFVPQASVRWQLPGTAAGLFRKFQTYAKGDGETGILFARHYRWLTRKLVLMVCFAMLSLLGLASQLHLFTGVGIVGTVLALRDLLLPYWGFINGRSPVARVVAVCIVVFAQSIGFVSGSRDKRRQRECLAYLGLGESCADDAADDRICLN